MSIIVRCAQTLKSIGLRVLLGAEACKPGRVSPTVLVLDERTGFIKGSLVLHDASLICSLWTALLVSFPSFN